ncbi:hypothetical protein [Microbacterium allomyrinae]|jgi:hypothetical protein|nr:hypothetical protein [Microbacterium allomyrinae]
MFLVLALAGLCVVGVVAAIVATVRDSRGPVPTLRDYDTRRPVL